MKIVHSQTYDVLIGDDCLQNIKLTQYSAIAVLVDENTRNHCLDIFLSQAQIDTPLIIEIQSGEVNKTMSNCQLIWKKLT
jgi:3-dehydroquinate synthase